MLNNLSGNSDCTGELVIKPYLNGDLCSNKIGYKGGTQLQEGPVQKLREICHKCTANSKLIFLKPFTLI
jgi:hypothetical protein